MIAINTYGTLYLLAKDDTITSMADLKGKTIGATGQGANPEYILNDLKVKYKFKYFGINCLINNNAAMKLYRSIGFSPISTYLMKI